jgi:1,2-diacylglycerol 3-alpha-glucosyltransferase
MRVAIVTKWFPAGAGYVSRAYKESLETQGCKVFIYARGGEYMRGDSFWDGDNVRWAPLVNGVIDTSDLISWVKRNAIDVVFFNEERYWKPLLELKKVGITIGAYVDYYTQITVPAFDVYDFLICNTKRHYSVFDWHDGANFIQWGTDTEKFKPTNEEPEINKPIKFLVSAGWQLAKNADRRGSRLALDAFVKTKGEAEFLFYSQAPLDKAPNELVKQIESDKRIKFISGTFEPFPFNEADVYVYPSKLDGIGLTLPEALSSGLASITTNCAPMNEFVQDGRNGLLVEVEKYLGRHDGYYWPENICKLDMLRDCMQFYIDNPKTVYEHKINARKDSLNFFDWKVNSVSLFDIFQKALNNKRTLTKETKARCNQIDNNENPSIAMEIKRIASKLKYNIKHKF